MENSNKPTSNLSDKSFATQAEPLVISVHVPKTAGTSFRHSLQDHFGDALHLKYGEKTFNTPKFERNQKALQAAIDNIQNDITGIHCIHGHFLPVQFLLLHMVREVYFLTWMRHPVDRLISDYYHTLRNYSSDALPFQKRVVNEKWSLGKYCLCEELRNVYHQFFWGFPLEYFDFIGITEFYQSDFEYFRNNYLNKTGQAYYENVNTDYKRTNLDRFLRAEIETYHDKDMKLYHRAIEMRNARISSGNPEKRQPASDKTKSARRWNWITNILKAIRN